MNKQQAIKFLEEQREARLIGNNPNSQSDFDKWQLKQAETFQEIIDWINEETFLSECSSTWKMEYNSTWK